MYCYVNSYLGSLKLKHNPSRGSGHGFGHYIGSLMVQSWDRSCGQLWGLLWDKFWSESCGWSWSRSLGWSCNYPSWLFLAVKEKEKLLKGITINMMMHRQCHHHHDHLRGWSTLGAQITDLGSGWIIAWHIALVWSSSFPLLSLIIHRFHCHARHTVSRISFAPESPLSDDSWWPPWH